MNQTLTFTQIGCRQLFNSVTLLWQGLLWRVLRNIDRRLCYLGVGRLLLSGKVILLHWINMKSSLKGPIETFFLINGWCYKRKVAHRWRFFSHFGCIEYYILCGSEYSSSSALFFVAKTYFVAKVFEKRTELGEMHLDVLICQCKTEKYQTSTYTYLSSFGHSQNNCWNNKLFREIQGCMLFILLKYMAASSISWIIYLFTIFRLRYS